MSASGEIAGKGTVPVKPSFLLVPRHTPIRPFTTGVIAHGQPFPRGVPSFLACGVVQPGDTPPRCVQASIPDGRFQPRQAALDAASQTNQRK